MKQSHCLAALAAITLCACTQPAAQIVNKGGQFYGRDGASGYNQAAPAGGAYHNPHFVEPAAVDSVSVETLEAPEPITLNNDQGSLSNDSMNYAQAAPASSSLPNNSPFQSVVRDDIGLKESELAPEAGATAVATTPTDQSLSIANVEPADPIEPVENTVQPAPLANGEQLAALDEFIASPESSIPAAQIVNAVSNEPTISQTSASHFIWPVEGNVLSAFGKKSNGLTNDGINIAAPEGEPIWAAAGGEVVYAGNEVKGYGNMAILRHDDGFMTAYAHASDIIVNKGQRVNQGDLLGYVGSTGSVDEAQLHFGIREGNSPVDPQTLLPSRLAANK